MYIYIILYNYIVVDNFIQVCIIYMCIYIYVHHSNCSIMSCVTPIYLRRPPVFHAAQPGAQAAPLVYLASNKKCYLKCGGFAIAKFIKSVQQWFMVDMDFMM